MIGIVIVIESADGETGAGPGAGVADPDVRSVWNVILQDVRCVWIVILHHIARSVVIVLLRHDARSIRIVLLHHDARSVEIIPLRPTVDTLHFDFV